MNSLEFKNVGKTFGSTPALRGFSLAIPPSEFFVLLGPTGAGKTTTLRCTAGLETLDEGEIRLAGRDISGEPPAFRDVGFIFQQYALYPRYTVFENMAFPLRSNMQKVPHDEIRRRIFDAAERLQIAHLLDRRTDKLAGGEMQRVAIGRAIVRRPRAYLMDEPLSSLDAKLRDGLRSELRALQRETGITTLYVTHDQLEAMSLADRIGVLRNGKLEQAGTPREVYDRPVNTFVASFVGSPAINLFPMEILNGELVAPRGAFRVSLDARQCDRLGNRSLVFWGARPEDVRIRSTVGPRTFRAKITVAENLGADDVLRLEVGGLELRSVCSPLAQHRAGDLVNLEMASEFGHFFDAVSGKLLD